MKPFKLSLLATLLVALTACSSSSKDSVDNYLASEANQAQVKANQKVKELEQQLAEAKKKLAEAASAQELSEAKTLLETTQAELNKEKERADGLQATLDLIEAKKRQEQELIEAKQREEQERVTKNANAVKAPITDNGTIPQQYTVEDPWSGSSETKNIKLAYISGKQMTLDNGVIKITETSPTHEQIDTLIVDGKPITLYSQEEIRAWNKTAYETKVLTGEVTGKVSSLSNSRFGTDFDQVRYGYVTKDGKTTLFVQGTTTPTDDTVISRFDRIYTQIERLPELETMPTGETAYNYAGTAFYGKDGAYQELAVKALADFNSKKVKVELSENNETKVTLGGIISGNTFAGEYQGAVTSGAFYGNGAQDMAGTFYQTEGENKDKHGVFGATTPSSSAYRFKPTNVIETDNLQTFEVNP